MFFSYKSFFVILNEGPYDMFKTETKRSEASDVTWPLRKLIVVLIYFTEKCLTVSPLSVIVKQKLKQAMINSITYFPRDANFGGMDVTP